MWMYESLAVPYVFDPATVDGLQQTYLGLEGDLAGGAG